MYVNGLPFAIVSILLKFIQMQFLFWLFYFYNLRNLKKSVEFSIYIFLKSRGFISILFLV